LVGVGIEVDEFAKSQRRVVGSEKAAVKRFCLGGLVEAFVGIG